MTSEDFSSPSEPRTGRTREQKLCFGRRANLAGTPFHDQLSGTPFERDVIVTLGGNDVVTALGAGDVVCTGTGHDRVVAEPGDAFAGFRVKLGQGDDRIALRGPEGRGGTIRAGAGDDTVLLSKRSVPFVVQGPGDDLVRARPRPECEYVSPGFSVCLRFRSATGSVRVNLAAGRATGQGRDRILNIRCVITGAFNDVLVGTDRADWIETGGGLNRVRAGAGSDYVTGGNRADEVYAGFGGDRVIAGGGWDRVYGGPGGDLLAGSTAIAVDVPGPLQAGDFLDGGAGDDYLFGGAVCEYNVGPSGVSEQDAPNELFGGPGNDGLSGEGGNDRLDGGPGVDSGQGGWRDGRIDWITSVEIYDDCASPYRYG